MNRHHRFQPSRRFATRALPAALLLACAALPAHAARYTYHGELMDEGKPASGSYELRVTAYGKAASTIPLAAPIELSNVKLVDGAFAIDLDLPDSASGTTWVQVALRQAGSGAPYETLGSPQPIANVNSGCPFSWATDGNTGLAAGSFLGIADPADTSSLELRARNVRVASFGPGVASGANAGAGATVLGSKANVAVAVGSTVSGGGATHDANGNACPTCANSAIGLFSTVGGGKSNYASGASSSIGGGEKNYASGDSATIAGGYNNSAVYQASVMGGGNNHATGLSSAIAGGVLNTAGGNSSTVGGGSQNTAFADNATVAGGAASIAGGQWAIVPGGHYNCAGGDASFAAGTRAKVRDGTDNPCTTVTDSGDANGDEGTFVWADSQNTDFTSTGPDQFLVRASRGMALNTNTPVLGGELTIGPGLPNDLATSITLVQPSDMKATLAVSSNGYLVLDTSDADIVMWGKTGVGIGTSTMGAATDLRSSELVVKPRAPDLNSDISLFTADNRGHGLVSTPGSGGNPGEFYITEIDGRTASPAYFPKLKIGTNGVTYVQGGAVGDISDARLKKNIAAIERPLDTLLGLRGHTFEYRDPAKAMNAPGTRIGFVAQEVREVLPAWVSEDADGTLAVVPTGFPALTVEAMRDLKSESDARLSALEAENAAQHAELAALRSELSELRAALRTRGN